MPCDTFSHALPNVGDGAALNRQWEDRAPAEIPLTYGGFVRAGPKLLSRRRPCRKRRAGLDVPCESPTRRVEKARMSSLASVVPSTRCADTGRTGTNYIAIFAGAIAAFIIAPVLRRRLSRAARSCGVPLESFMARARPDYWQGLRPLSSAGATRSKNSTRKSRRQRHKTAYFRLLRAGEWESVHRSSGLNATAFTAPAA